MDVKKQGRRAAALAAVALGLIGCTSPMERASQQALREQLLAMNRQYLQAAAPGQIKELSRTPSDVEVALGQQQGRMEELEAMSGPAAYRSQAVDYGTDIRGQAEAQRVGMSLRDAIRLAVQHNSEVQVTRLLPAIGEQQIVQAEAVFDATLFSDLQWGQLDTPRPFSSSPLSQTGGPQQSETWSLNTGIRKLMSTGGQISVSTEFGRESQDPTFYDVKDFDTANVALSLQQPLLRNFGSDVIRSQVVLARNARDQANQDLRTRLLETAFAVEQGYWNLVLAESRLAITTRLLERTIRDRQTLEMRREFDVKPATLTDVAARVERRRTDVIIARREVRNASDVLKRLLNTPDLPLAGDAMIAPADQPVEVAMTFSYLDAVTTALRARPEIVKSLSQIDDASVRQRVADNGRLPNLNLAATLRYNAIGVNTLDAYGNLAEGDFIDYILGAQFEMPIGNRAAEALYQQRQVERRAGVINYQRVVQDVTLEVKDALRSLITAYELIGATRAARRAAADNLRALEVEEKAGVPLTPEFIDLKLRREESLAQTEIEEVTAVTGYNVAIARFYQTMGTLLERNGIEFTTTPQP